MYKANSYFNGSAKIMKESAGADTHSLFRLYLDSYFRCYAEGKLMLIIFSSNVIKLTGTRRTCNELQEDITTYAPQLKDTII